MEQKTVLEGFAIVVADRGYVYVGNCKVDDQFCIITNTRNIRRWGTEKGLGQLALEGPQKETVLDQVGTARIPMRAILSIIDTDSAKWSLK